jgi:hypothetical protein
VTHIDQLQQDLRAARRRYDELKRGETAPMRRCRIAGELALEAAYWRVGGSLAYQQNHLVHVLLLFPLAPQRRALSPTFSFGRFLRRQLGDSDGAKLRFRRLLASGDREELDHRSIGVLWAAIFFGSSPKAITSVVVGPKTSTPRSPTETRAAQPPRTLASEPEEFS